MMQTIVPAKIRKLVCVIGLALIIFAIQQLGLVDNNHSESTVHLEEGSSLNVTEPNNQGQNISVTFVTDGDTFKVKTADGISTVRILGINTPETVDPRRPVECFGIEASNRAKELLNGKVVELHLDPSQDSTDRYGRQLRYVSVDGIDIGAELIRGGYAYEYTHDIPHARQEEYRSLEAQARESGVGLWGSGCDQ
jgi:micrococcal nuclease